MSRLRAVHRLATALAATAGVLTLAACGGGDQKGSTSTRAISVDGSSTVYPVTQAVAEEYMVANQGTRVSVGYSGTGGGFKKFCRGETDVSNASRPISPEEEELCSTNGVDYTRFTVAFDGITVTVNPKNDWAQCITTEELRQIWQPASEVDSWSDVRDDWPDRDMTLFGPGTDSGTFDYFTESIMGEEAASRANYTASEDDNVLVMGVAGDAGALGYFGYAYYAENQDRLKALEVDGGEGCVAPTESTIESGDYQPLSRPLFIYVRDQALQEQAVQDFVRFYLQNARELVPQVGYISLPADRYQEQLANVPGPSVEPGGAGTAPAGDTAGEASSSG